MDEVPEVDVEVFEDGDCAIGFFFGRADELDAVGDHFIIVAPEVVGGEEEEDAAACLVADCFLLGWGRGSAEYNPNFRFIVGRWSNHNPAFILSRLIRIFNDRKVELFRIKGNRFIIITDV